jgi:hypothetical protein
MLLGAEGDVVVIVVPLLPLRYVNGILWFVHHDDLQLLLLVVYLLKHSNKYTVKPRQE